jgi:hypothetical protein
MAQSKQEFSRSLPVYPSQQRQLREELEQINQNKILNQKQSYGTK